MTDQSTPAEIRSEVIRELIGIKFKKANVTRNVNKCLKFIEVFRGEQTQGNSPLLKQSATDIMTLYNQAKDSIEDLEESMDKYLRLSSLTHEGPDAELDKLIKQPLKYII